MLVTDIAIYLDGIGIVDFYQTGYDADNNCFINNMPDSPNNIVVIIDTGGEGNIVGFPDSVRNFQICVRNELQVQANYISWLIYNALTSIDTHGYIKTDNNRQLLIKAKNPPIFIGKDTNGLFEFSTNYQCWTQSDLL